MSWSKDVASSAGLFRISPQMVLVDQPDFRYGAAVEYGMPLCYIATIETVCWYGKENGKMVVNAIKPGWSLHFVSGISV